MAKQTTRGLNDLTDLYHAFEDNLSIIPAPEHEFDDTVHCTFLSPLPG